MSGIVFIKETTKETTRSYGEPQDIEKVDVFEQVCE